jgi:hypothetical protein
MQEEWCLKHVCISHSQRKSKSGLNEVAILGQAGNGFCSYWQADNSFRCSIAVDERSGLIACNGYPGELQMVDASPVVKYVHQVLPYTRVSKKEVYTKMYVPSVSNFRFFTSGLGAFLATIDVTRGHDTAAESSLKFWSWSPAKNRYRLNATVDRPHGSCRVTGLDFIPMSDKVCCATSSVDSSVKVWHGSYVSTSHTTNQSLALAKSSQPNKNNAFSAAESMQIKWSCAFSFSYRETPSYCLRSSFDGSVLAVGHGNAVALWDHSTVTLKHSFTSYSTAMIYFVRFIEPLARPAAGGGCGVCYLVVGSKDVLQVYDLLTLELSWSISGDYDCFAVAKDESCCVKVNQGFEVLEQGWITACTRDAVTASRQVGSHRVCGISVWLIFFVPHNRYSCIHHWRKGLSFLPN